MPDDEITIKVTTKDKSHCYYVLFDRNSHDLVTVQEYKSIYMPHLGRMPPRVREVVLAARTKLDETPATLGEEN